MLKYKITRFTNGKKESILDDITEEVSITLSLENKELTTLICTPKNIKSLVTGYLFSSGIINSIEDIQKIKIDKRKQAAYINLQSPYMMKDFVFKRLQPPGCGTGTVFYNTDKVKKKRLLFDLKISQEYIFKIMKDFQKSSIIFKKTGGVHSAALADKKGIIFFKEDIGRHNAVDKIIGDMLLKKIKMKNKILLSSGRLSSEIIHKVLMAEIPVVISRSAPTDRSIDICKKNKITVVGFVRGQRMNIYSYPMRITK